MGMVSFEVLHTLTMDEAKQRMLRLAEYWTSKYGVKIDWTGSRARMTGKVLGITLEGNVEVFRNKVAVAATDPGFLLRDKAKKYLLQKFGMYLAPGWNGRDDESVMQRL